MLALAIRSLHRLSVLKEKRKLKITGLGPGSVTSAGLFTETDGRRGSFVPAAQTDSSRLSSSLCTQGARGKNRARTVFHWESHSLLTNPEQDAQASTRTDLDVKAEARVVSDARSELFFCRIINYGQGNAAPLLVQAEDQRAALVPRRERSTG